MNKVTLVLEFDDADEQFGRFCKAMIDAGFEDLVRQMGQELLKEEKRRNLPVAEKLSSVL